MASVELRHLRYLLAVAEHGNFTRAAEELHISQPTLSQQIKQLERTVGVQLLDRTGRRVRLTDAGAVYTDHAGRALRDLAAAERAVHDVQNLSRGHLRLGATPTFTAYLLGPLVAGLHARHPGIGLTLTEMPQDRIEAALLADDLDLGIAFTGHHLPGVAATALFTETLTLVTGAPVAAGRGAPLPVQDLTGRQLALLSDDFATRGHIDAYFSRHRPSRASTVEANSIQALTRSSGAPTWPPSCRTPSPTTTPTSPPSPSNRPCRPAPSLSCTGKAPTSRRRPAPSPGSSTRSSARAATRPPRDPPTRRTGGGPRTGRLHPVPRGARFRVREHRGGTGRCCAVRPGPRDPSVRMELNRGMTAKGLAYAASRVIPVGPPPQARGRPQGTLGPVPEGRATPAGAGTTRRTGSRRRRRASYPPPAAPRTSHRHRRRSPSPSRDRRHPPRTPHARGHLMANIELHIANEMLDRFETT